MNGVHICYIKLMIIKIKFKIKINPRVKRNSIFLYRGIGLNRSQSKKCSILKDEKD